MLKSVSTQFAATLFFGPIGLAYCSIASAVFLTLLLAVLYFTGFGVLAVVLIWPVAIVLGLVFVKLHNDGVRSSGSRLLLGPGEERSLASAISSWASAIAVVALVLTAGYLVYLYLPANTDGSNKLGRIVDGGVNAGDSNSAIAGSDTSEVAANSQQGNDNFAVIALPQREVTSVVLDSNGNVTEGDAQSALNAGQPELVVDSEVVNLRRGPGTDFAIVTQIEKGDRLFEFARDGQWINVETENTGYSGWVFSSLVK